MNLKKLILDLDKCVWSFKYEAYVSAFGMPMRPFARKLKELYPNKSLVGAEIGVMYGDHAYSFLNNLSIKKLYLIDPFINYKDYSDNWTGYGEPPSSKIYERVQDRFCDYTNVEILREFSSVVAGMVPDNLDFVYVDGNHAYEYVKRDIKLYWTKINPGGMLGGHDISNNSCKEHDGIIRAVAEFAVKNNLQIYIDQPDWWFIKN